jgi:hypothetical protein
VFLFLHCTCIGEFVVTDGGVSVACQRSDNWVRWSPALRHAQKGDFWAGGTRVRPSKAAYALAVSTGTGGLYAADRVVQRSITFALRPRNRRRREKGDAQCRIRVLDADSYTRPGCTTRTADEEHYRVAIDT